LPPLQEATRLDPQNFFAWFVQGYCHGLLGRHGDAVACYTVCVALRPEAAASHFNRGLARLFRNDEALHDNRLALTDFDEAARRAADPTDAYLNRALARQRLGDPRGAAADLTRALGLRPGLTEAYFRRAAARRQAGDAVGLAGGAAAGLAGGAAADEAEGLRRPPATEAGLLARGAFLLRADPAAALADYDAVLRRNPRSLPALHNKAYLLAERLDRLADAVALLDEALTDSPDSLALRAGRAVYRARLGRRADALADAAACLRDDGSAQTEYKVACVYALTARECPEDRAEALRHLAAALRKGYDRFDVIARDKDLDALRQGPELGRLLRAAQDLRGPQPRP
jgi:hypothetical protein